MSRCSLMAGVATVVAAASDDAGGVLVAAAVAGVLLFAGGWMLGRQPAARHDVLPSPGAQTSRPLSDVAGIERLAAAIIQLAEVVPDREVAVRLQSALHDGGVEPIDATGERFDPTRHVAVGSRPAARLDEQGRVAAMRRPGYRFGDQVIRQPEVVVYEPDRR